MVLVLDEFLDRVVQAPSMGRVQTIRTPGVRQPLVRFGAKREFTYFTYGARPWASERERERERAPLSSFLLAWNRDRSSWQLGHLQLMPLGKFLKSSIVNRRVHLLVRTVVDEMVPSSCRELRSA